MKSSSRIWAVWMRSWLIRRGFMMFMSRTHSVPKMLTQNRRGISGQRIMTGERDSDIA